MNPVKVVQRQLEAYNNRDLAGFLENFAEDVQVFRLPLLEPSISGKPQLAAFYATKRFNRPDLQAQLLNRTVLGQKIFDHERIYGVQEIPFEIVVVYQVQRGLIQTMWAFD